MASGKAKSEKVMDLKQRESVEKLLRKLAKKVSAQAKIKHRIPSRK